LDHPAPRLKTDKVGRFNDRTQGTEKDTNTDENLTQTSVN